MAYNKTNWVNNETPINAENMNKIEDGVFEADRKATEGLTKVNQSITKIGILNAQVGYKVTQEFDNQFVDHETDQKTGMITFNLDDPVNVLKPVYLYIHTYDGVIYVIIPDPYNKSYVLYANDENNKTYDSDDLIDSLCFGFKGDNYLTINLKGLVENFYQWDTQRTSVTIEYIECDNPITVEL